MSSVIFSNEEARFLRLVLRLVDRPVPDLDDDQASTLLESLIAAGLHRHSRPSNMDKEKPEAAEAIRVLVIGERKAGKDGLWSKLSTCSTSSSPELASQLHSNPRGSLHGCRQTMTIPTHHHTIDIYELSPDCLQVVQPVPASHDQETNVSTLFATEQQQQQMATVSETEAEHLAQALAITEAAILVYDTSDEESLGYLQSLAGVLDRAVELHQHQHQQKKKRSPGSEQGINGTTINNDQAKTLKRSTTRNESNNVGTMRRSAWSSLKRASSERKAERTKSKESSSSASASSPTTPSPPEQSQDSTPTQGEQKYHFLLLGVKPDDPADAEGNTHPRTPRSREYQRTSTSSAPSVDFLEISYSSRAEWTAALDMLGGKVTNGGRRCRSRSRQYQHGQQHGNDHSVMEGTTLASVHNESATDEVSGGKGQGQGAQKHHQTQNKMQRRKPGKDHTQTQPALESLESMALTLFSTPSTKLNTTSRHPRLSHHQKGKRTLARSRWGLLKSVLSVGSILRADVKWKKTTQRQLAGGK